MVKETRVPEKNRWPLAKELTKIHTPLSDWVDSNLGGEKWLDQ